MHFTTSRLGCAVCAAILLVVAAPGMATELYWTDFGTKSVCTSQLDGTAVETLVSGRETLRALTLDLTHGKMYWGEKQDSVFKIMRANLDGSGTHELLSGYGASGIAVDPSAGWLYWVGGLGGAVGEHVRRARLDGSNVTTLVSGLVKARDIALDLDGGKMYWTDESAAKIQRANLDGSGMETLLSGAEPYGIALDLDAGKMYWTEPNIDRIQRADLDGSNVEDLVDSGLALPLHIVLAPELGKMYWTDYGVDAIKRANLDGSDVEVLLDSSTVEDPCGLSLGSESIRLPGDANLDGAVTDADYTVWADHYLHWPATWSMGDFDGSGEVTDGDYTIWADNYGRAAGIVPEPATIVLLGFGLLTVRSGRSGNK
jgi:low-density lipoprotein receptor class B